MRDTITLIGTIGTDPALQTSDDGRPFLNFRLVTHHSWQDNTTHQYVDGEPNWFTVKAFRTLAVNTHASVEKGQRLIVHGRLQVRNWVSGDRSGTQVEVMADHIGHDLSLGTAKYARMRAPDAARSGSDDGASESPFASSAGDPPAPDGSPMQGRPDGQMPDDEPENADEPGAREQPAGAESPF